MSDSTPQQPQALQECYAWMGTRGTSHWTVYGFDRGWYYNRKKAPSVQIGEVDSKGNIVTIYVTEADAAYIRGESNLVIPLRPARPWTGS